MRGLRGWQLLCAAAGAVAALLLLLGGGAAVAQDECTLSVKPAVAQAGTVFTLRGSGFTPTELVLTKQGGAPTTITLDLGTDDPFKIQVASKLGDEGTWTATASQPGSCSASVTFVATLRSTDAAPESGGAPNVGLVLFLAGLGVVGGLAVAARRAPWKMRS